MYKKNHTGIIGIIITIILLILLVILSNMSIEKFSKVETGTTSIIMPIQNILTYLKNKMQGNTDFFTDINSIQKQNEELQQKNSELEKQLRELEIVKAENATLKEYVNLKDKYTNFKTIPAYIIDKDISNFSSTLVINVGQKDGIETNMAVIADKGLVGHVISVANSTSKVQVIIDSASTLSATMSTTRDGIICKGMLGENNKLKVMYIPTDANILQGDNIETSGMGGIYPKGIRVGTIKEIVETRNITDRYAILETAVDFSKLETVLVITNQI